jgi:RNA polymerase sigma factor (sigma-70 family)
MVIEEQTFADQGKTWQRLFDQAQAAWMSGEYDLAGDYFWQLRGHTTPLLLSIASQQASASHAEDIVAEAHIELYRSMSTGKAVKNVGGLLRTIVQRRAIDAVRRAANKYERPADDDFWARYAEVDAVATDNVEDDVTSRLAAIGLVNQILDELPPELRLVLFTRHGLAMSVEETATHLGLTEDQVKKRTKEALARAQAIAHEKGLLL